MSETTNPPPASEPEPENKNSFQYIYPFNDSLGSVILSRIVYHSKKKAEKAEMERIDKFKKYVLRLSDFYTLQELAETLKFDSSLTQAHKSSESLAEVFDEMMDVKNRGKTKYGYLYPVIQEDSKDFRAKILVSITPESVPIPTSVYRGIFLKYNKSPIMNYLSSFSYEQDSDYYKNPMQFLFKNEGGEKSFNPYGLSILEKMRQAVNNAFDPFTPIELPDFFQDLGEYYSNSDSAVRVNDYYYILKKDIILNRQGIPTREPEVFFHFVTLYYAIEKVILEDINQICDRYGLPVSKSQIKDFVSKFPITTVRDPNLLTERLASLDSIMQKINLNPRMEPWEKNIITSVKDGISILFDFNKQIKITNDILEDGQKKLLLELITLHIEEHFKLKKTLYVYDPERPFVESHERENNTPENKLLVKNYIFKNYYFYETSTREGRLFYYLLNPKCSLEVMANLADVSQKNESYQNQYKAVKLLREKMIKDNVKDLDKNIDTKQKYSLERDLKDIKEKEIKLEEIKERKRSYNSTLALTSGAIFTMIILMILMINQNPLIMILLPLSIILSYYMGKIFKKKKKDLLNNNPNLNHFAEASFDSKSSYYIDIAKKVLFENNSKIEDRILDKQKLSSIYFSLVPKMRENRPSTFNEMSNDNIVENLLDVTERFCLVITVPPEISRGNLAKQIYIAKDYLKDDFIKAQLLEFCINKQKVAKLNKSTDIERFFRYIAEILDHDFSVYFK